MWLPPRRSHHSIVLWNVSESASKTLDLAQLFRVPSEPLKVAIAEGTAALGKPDKGRVDTANARLVELSDSVRVDLAGVR